MPWSSETMECERHASQSRLASTQQGRMLR
uniref:Uncharacterized protein n=1 Tax=Anguilla anguilla TaxID=7936 RepID=A0A0E9PGC7_ANGAN